MSSFSEFLELWDGFMPQPVRESDIKSPTESSFRRLLMLILKKLFVDTTCFEAMENENGSKLQSSRKRLVCTINHFSEIAFAKSHFCYMDLVQPTHKKVLNTLKYLLNYAIYVENTYRETILESAKKIKERDELQTNKNELRRNIESIKIKEQQSVNAISELDAKIPQKKADILSMQEKENQLKKELAALSENMERSDMRLLELKSKISGFNENIVSEEEANSIIDTKNTVAQQLEEHEDIIAAGRQKLKENSTTIEKIRACTTKMENLLVFSSTFDTVDIKSMKKNVDTLKMNVTNLKNNIACNNEELDSIDKSLNLIQENIEKLTVQHANLEQSFAAKNSANFHNLKEKALILRKLEIEEDEMLLEKEKITDELEMIYTVVSSITKQISQSIFYD